MKDITSLFLDQFLPTKALLFYKSSKDGSFYIESHDLNEDGIATNMHPLNENESHDLATALLSSTPESNGFLKIKNLLPENLLWYAPEDDGAAMWYTKAMQANLFFASSLSNAIADGVASLPPLLWKASRTELRIWALENEQRPQMETKLYHAPFFNLYADGRVCMGNVRIDIAKNCNLDSFITEWTNYFFASKFSHLLTDTSPVRMNIVRLWQNLIGTGKPFPIKQLKKTDLKISDLPL